MLLGVRRCIMIKVKERSSLMHLTVFTTTVPLSLVPLVDFLGKVEEDCVRKVLSVTRDEFL